MAHDNRVEVHKEPPRLTVRQLTKDDRGMYQCFASNSWDQVQATSELDMGDAGPELVYWFVGAFTKIILYRCIFTLIGSRNKPYNPDLRYP